MDGRFCCLLTLLLLITSCQAPSSQKQGPSVSPTVPLFRIGALLPLSGPMAPHGQEVLRGIQLAIDRHNRETGKVVVQLALHDTAHGATPIEKQLSALLHDSHPLAVIGPLLSLQVEAVAKVADDEKVPLITPIATLPNVRQLSPYVFSTALTYRLQAEQLAAYAMGRLGYRRFAVMHPDNSYGRQLAHFFVEEAKRQGGEVIDVESYQEQETDFAKQIARLKSAYWRRIQQDRQTNRGKASDSRQDGKGQHTLSSHRSLDAIYLPGSFLQAVLIATQLRFHDLKVRLLGSSAWHSSDLAHFPDKAIQGGLFVDSFFAESQAPSARKFVEAYRQRFGTESTPFAAQAYEAAEVILTGIRGGAASGKQLRAYLEQADALPSFLGPTSFDRHGVLARKLLVFQVGQNGQLLESK
ncbi:MAG: penicillin-binding protein activator [Nitrospira sp.]|nr:penicillin-binding protein activator [Nitrospira sp.]